MVRLLNNTSWDLHISQIPKCPSRQVTHTNVVELNILICIISMQNENII
jgi:hypothetical protein